MAGHGVEVGVAQEAVRLLELPVVPEGEEEGDWLGSKLGFKDFEGGLVVLLDTGLELVGALVPLLAGKPERGGQIRCLAPLRADCYEVQPLIGFARQIPATVEHHALEIGGEDDVRVLGADLLGDDAHDGVPAQLVDDFSAFEIGALAGIVKGEEDGLRREELVFVEEGADVLKADWVVAGVA